MLVTHISGCSNISDFTMWTQQVIDKINNRSMNNVRSLLKVR